MRELAEILRGVVSRGSPEDRRLLAWAIEDYARKFPTSYRFISQGRANAALSYLMESLIEGSDARPGPSQDEIHNLQDAQWRLRHG